MPKIQTSAITKAIAGLCIKANTVLRPDIYSALTDSLRAETNERAKGILKALLDNADCACKLDLAICQDTGLPYVFVELGQEVLIQGGDFLRAVNKGIDQGYSQGGLRNSVVLHPLKRDLTPGFSPGVVYVELVKGGNIDLTVFPKGFGSENKSSIRMFNPTDDLETIKAFILESVKQAGPGACPPFVIGIGIGGGMDKAAVLAKKALLFPLNKRNPDGLLSELEDDLLKMINHLGIGPMGLGGKTTVLGVNILAGPTHIAGLAVAVNISCHALRSASERISGK